MTKVLRKPLLSLYFLLHLTLPSDFMIMTLYQNLEMSLLSVFSHHQRLPLFCSILVLGLVLFYVLSFKSPTPNSVFYPLHHLKHIVPSSISCSFNPNSLIPRMCDISLRIRNLTQNGVEKGKWEDTLTLSSVQVFA